MNLYKGIQIYLYVCKYVPPMPYHIVEQMQQIGRGLTRLYQTVDLLKRVGSMNLYKGIQIYLYVCKYVPPMPYHIVEQMQQIGRGLTRLYQTVLFSTAKLLTDLVERTNTSCSKYIELCF